MQNLDQIRARNALAFSTSPEGAQVAGQQGGEVIKKIPPQIINHGLLMASSYAFDETTQGQPRNLGHRLVYDAIAKHLSDPAVNVLPAGCDTAEKLVRHLTKEGTSSNELRWATAEAMAWLVFARRFVNRPPQNAGGNR
ncbi:MAG TPA: type III-B CRISPR module-associated protein Cmr5 [Opitutales bacterium]|nr:type III-B CRISPR module-associated protein Cmr5 [Opitutales bacterium]